MVKVETIRDDNEKRILRCSEGNRIWYQIWITQLDMNCIERYFDGYGEVKRWWLWNLQQYYLRYRMTLFLACYQMFPEPECWQTVQLIKNRQELL